MDNTINNVSFGAHLSLKNVALDQHISRNMANKFTKATQSIEGIMSLEKSPCGVLIASLNGKEVIMDADEFYGLENKEKINTLVKAARYIKELIRFDKLPRVAEANLDKHIRTLDKIVGDNTVLGTFNDVVKMHMVEKYA